MNEMVKISKRQYKTRRLALQIALSQVQEQIEAWHMELDSGIADDRNYLYDEEYKLNQAINDLEREYRTRHWTEADYSKQVLIANNID